MDRCSFMLKFARPVSEVVAYSLRSRSRFSHVPGVRFWIVLWALLRGADATMSDTLLG